MILFPNHERGTMILAELPNSVAIVVISDTWRVERLFNLGLLSTEFSLYICIIIVSYILSGPSLYIERLISLHSIIYSFIIII